MTNELETRIKIWLRTLQKNLYQPVDEISFVAFYTDKQYSPEEAAGKAFEQVKQGDRWGKEWEYGWFLAKIPLKEWATGKRIVMNLNMGGEATLYVNGEPFGSRRDDWIIEEHHFICDNYLTREAKGNETFTLLAECYAGHSRPEEAGECISGPSFLNRQWTRPDGNKARRTVGKSTVGIWREEAYHLYLEASALYEIWQNEQEGSLRRSELEEALRKFCMELDFEQTEEAYLDSVRQTRRQLEPYLQCKNGSTAPVFHMIGHAHIDLAWLWPVEETMRKCARTMAAQLRHMEEYPEYKMVISQPWLIEQIEKRYPTLYRKMEEKIQDGQLIPEGGMWVEADTNIPSGESLIRQFLYGKKYLKEKFGIESSLLWLPDVFGYCGNLPQIMAGCGIANFTTHKIFWTYNGGAPFPYHYFNWKGIDGTEIPTFIHVEYSSASNAGTLISRWRDRAQKTGLRRFLQPFGYGDGGGGATRDHIENSYLLADMEGAPKTIFDEPKHFFDCIREDGCPVNEYVGELYYQAHRATYTSQAKTKQGNRRGEEALREAEFWNTSAFWLKEKLYPSVQMEAAWKLLLFQQFHDILPGSSIGRVYEQAEEAYEQLQEQCSKLLDEAAEVFLDKKEAAITCFNSLSWERQAIVKLPTGWKGAAYTDGRRVVVQENSTGSCVLVSLPACGTTILRKEQHPYKAKINTSVHAYLAENGKEAVLFNEKVTVKIDCCGRLTSIVDKESGREWAAAPCNDWKLYQDIPGHFEAWDIDSLYKEKEVDLLGEGMLEVAEGGPLIGTIQIKRLIGASEMIQHISLETGSSLIHIHTQIDWQEHHKLLKTVFPVTVRTQELCSEIQFGMIKRPNHTSTQLDKDRFEVCNHKWSAFMESGRGAAIINDCKYGISSTGNSMELTLLKASGFPDENADKGKQEFAYGFTFWNTPFTQSDVVQKAYEMNNRLTVMPGAAQLPSLFTLSNHNIILDTIKKAESGQGIVLRLYEAKGTETDVCIQTSLELSAAYLTDMLEHSKEEVLIQAGKIRLSFHPFEVKTLLIEKYRGE